MDDAPTVLRFPKGSVPEPIEAVAEPDQPEADGSGPDGASEPQPGFTVKLANFEGPFDLLLQLIGGRRLDVTEVALHIVTDEFIAYTKQLGAEADLDQTTEFLVVAATPPAASPASAPARPG